MAITPLTIHFDTEEIEPLVPKHVPTLFACFSATVLFLQPSFPLVFHHNLLGPYHALFHSYIIGLVLLQIVKQQA